VSTARGADDRVQLARLLIDGANIVERQGVGVGGIMRQAARLLLHDEIMRQAAPALPHGPSSGRCDGCAAELTQPAKGRRRKWCGEACRSRHRRR